MYPYPGLAAPLATPLAWINETGHVQGLRQDAFCLSYIWEQYPPGAFSAEGSGGHASMALPGTQGRSLFSLPFFLLLFPRQRTPSRRQ